MKRPTDYTGIYANWNVDVDGDDIPDAWFFGDRTQLPVLQYDFLGEVNQRPVLPRPSRFGELAGTPSLTQPNQVRLSALRRRTVSVR